MIRIATIAVTGVLLALFQDATLREITFSKDAAPILFERCAFCHRPGEVAPFSMLKYEEVRPWARSIKQQVLTRRMPPWFLDAHEGGFRNAMELKESEIQTLVAWVDGGAREGSARDLPQLPSYGLAWEIGEPDLVVKMTEPYKIPATGTVPQVTLPTDYVFPDDAWVQAIEIRPGNRRVVHEALAVNGPSGLATSMHLFAPGLPATILRDGYARFIPNGTRIYLRMHYNSIGQETSDQTEVGIKFAVKPVHTEVRTGIADANAIALSAVSSHDALATFPLAENARIHAFRPHMAVRGDSAKATLVLADRSRRVLLAISGWTDNWEYSYVPARPLDVPQGASLEYTTVPAVEPKPGESTHYLFFDWTPVNAANRDDMEPIFR